MLWLLSVLLPSSVQQILHLLHVTCLESPAGLKGKEGSGVEEIHYLSLSRRLRVTEPLRGEICEIKREKKCSYTMHFIVFVIIMSWWCPFLFYANIGKNKVSISFCRISSNGTPYPGRHQTVASPVHRLTLSASSTSESKTDRFALCLQIIQMSEESNVNSSLCDVLCSLQTCFRELVNVIVPAASGVSRRGKREATARTGRASAENWEGGEEQLLVGLLHCSTSYHHRGYAMTFLHAAGSRPALTQQR